MAIVTGFFIEIVVASYVLVKLCRPDFELPGEAQEVFEIEAFHFPDWRKSLMRQDKEISLYSAALCILASNSTGREPCLQRMLGNVVTFPLSQTLTHSRPNRL